MTFGIILLAVIGVTLIAVIAYFISNAASVRGKRKSREGTEPRWHRRAEGSSIEDAYPNGGRGGYWSPGDAPYGGSGWFDSGSSHGGGSSDGGGGGGD